jgi:hypothetical protein
MKLMKIFLLFGLINNMHATDYELFLYKIKTVWNYFTPTTQKQIKKFVYSSKNFATAVQNIDDPIVLGLFIRGLSEEEQKELNLSEDMKEVRIKVKEEMDKMGSTLEKLEAQGFSQVQSCNQLLGKWLTESGCEACGTIDHADLKQILDALKCQKVSKELKEIFD